MSQKDRCEYLLGAKGRKDLSAFVDSSTLFAFDLDGTLAAIAYDPQLIIVEESVRRSLLNLMRMARVAVVTGRSVSDARHHLGMEPHYLVGNHGAEGLLGQGEKEPFFNLVSAAWEKQAGICLMRHKRQDITMESKGASLSFHYRNAGNREEARTAILDCISELRPIPRHVSGKYVENIIPAEAPDKGSAIKALLKDSGCDRVLYAGDDETDEDVFSLRGVQVFSVHIGTGTKTKAKYYLKKQDELSQLIQSIIAILIKSDNPRE
jgi:trehalose 6-phosphate phosphatase